MDTRLAMPGRFQDFPLLKGDLSATITPELDSSIDPIVKQQTGRNLALRLACSRHVMNCMLIVGELSPELAAGGPGGAGNWIIT